MNSRERFLSACNRLTLDRPPVWIMRQAGRYLPEYRELKKKHGFLKLVQTPELAAEVTLQPIRRFQLDAAIVFSDILVIPESLGQPYTFREGGGIEMAFCADSESCINTLSENGLEERLHYVLEAIKLIKSELGREKALIGFGGSPWTLATYMVGGGTSQNHTQVKSMLYLSPELFHQLMEKITAALIRYFNLQIAAGVDAIQIFDTWAGILTPTIYWEASAQYLARIVRAIKGRIPVIIFSRGAHYWIEDLRRIEADVLGLDWTYSIARFYDDMKGTVAVQGNLDPTILNMTPDVVRRETLRILEEMIDRPGHIFNLGHGILPEARIESMETLVETVREFRSST